jgi:hypothetical protein
VKWITFARGFPEQDADHRMAQANFDIRGWQGRWWYTALTALFFCGRAIATANASLPLAALPRDLSEAVAPALRLGGLLDLPKHPDESRTEAGDRKHGDHP